MRLVVVTMVVVAGLEVAGGAAVSGRISGDEIPEKIIERWG